MLDVINMEQPDYLIHLGDHCGDIEEVQRRFPMLPSVSVKGNCDYGEFHIPEQRLAEYGGVRVLMAHGHKFGVKSGLLRYFMYACENQVDVALFGHTHCAYCENKSGIWLLNPGSCGYNRPSYGIVEIHDGKAVCYVKPVTEKENEI